MSRPKNAVPSYRLHKSSGRARVTVAGRDIWLGPWNSPESKERYARIVADLDAHGSIAFRPRSAPMSVAALTAAYLDHVEANQLYRKNGKLTSEISCIAVALHPLVKLFGEIPAAEFGPRALVTVRNELCKPRPPQPGEKRRRVHDGPIVRSSVNKHVDRIRRIFRWAVSMELVPAGTWEALRAVPGLRRGQSPLTRESRRVLPAPVRSVAAVLGHVSPTVAALIRVQWLTGARPGEAIQMRTGDLDRSGDVWIYRPASHKTEHHGVEREIVIGPKAQKVLTPFLSLAPTAFMFRGADTKRRKGLHITEAAYGKAIARACAELGVEHWTPNQLRHSAATRLRRDYGIEAARIMLGHTDAGTTLIYAERDRKKAAEIARRVG
jgi:integrase